MTINWLNLAAIALGGAIGSVLRFLITVFSASIPGGSVMLGTTLVNVLGCAAIGVLGEYCLIEGMLAERTKLALRVGLLGGLTTFSTFTLESALLAGSGRWAAAGLYVSANLLIGWFALFAGAALAKGWLT
ncbi:MAG: CrcB family protein [Pirellulales bacterium]|nr:CrcB family protein [Pirellulales bacterium]